MPARPGYARLLVLLLAAGLFGVPAWLARRDRSFTAPGRRVAAGVLVRHVGQGLATVRVIDVDLSVPGVRIEVAADNVAVRGGLITGRARTLPGWLSATGAVAGVNGGFFGETVGAEHKEIVGLLKRAGRVRVAAPIYRSRSSGKTYARSAFGVSRSGEPRIAWATSRPGQPQVLRSHPEPEFSGPGTAWSVQQALACGPRLIHNGRVAVTYQAERLASPGALPRTFVGYGGREGRPSHVVLCATDGMEFEECARFLTEYFRRNYGAPCREALALDGGASTQAAWREAPKEATAIRVEPDPGTTVPTAVLVFAGSAGVVRGAVRYNTNDRSPGGIDGSDTH